MAEVEALIRWHDTDALADPDLGAGLLAVKDLRGCALLPDAASILEACKGGYDATLQRQLADALEDPVRRNRPWLRCFASVFSPRRWSIEWWGAPSLDAALESCAAAVLDVVKTLRNVTGSLESEIESAASSPTTQSEGPRRRRLADALPDKPPSRWVACDLCEKWRRVPWHASIEIDENTSFKCADQVQWGVVPDEASCDVPNPSFGEDDVVLGCSSLPDSNVEGARSTPRGQQNFTARSPQLKIRKINHPLHREMDTSRVDGSEGAAAPFPRRSTRAAA